MSKFKLFLSLFVLVAMTSCKTTSTSGGAGSTAGTTAATATGEGPLVVADNAIRLNPNQTIDDQFGLGILPDEFVDGEKINHNFQPVYFSYDSAKIESAENSKLKMLAGFLESNQNLFLIVEGYCDERGSEEYNRALGERRALAVKTFIQNAAPSVQARINTMAYGEEKPVDTATTAEAYARNRRAEFIIISKR